MKEEALKSGQELLKKMPELSKNEIIVWKEKVEGENFRILCTLLKANAIPMKILCFSCNSKKERKETSILIRNYVIWL